MSRATALLSDGEFEVEAGSLARGSWEGSSTVDAGYAKLHADLYRAGVLVGESGDAVFTADYKFASASAAASVVMGQPANGAADSKTISGLTYKEWERARVGEDVSSSP